ncbi:MAG: NAD(P)/FAD-dependent oxidoreductase [Candidatus Micrarchaeota archaeon]
MKENYDIVVVGAGPAGSSAAKTAAKNGASVALLERRKEIGAPVRCGEGVGLHWIQDFGMKVSDKAISARINGAILYAPDLKHSATIRNEQTKGVVVDRKVFDKELAIDAGRAGAEVYVKTEVVDVLKSGGKISGVRARTDGENVDVLGEIVIAADGGESVISRLAGLNTLATLYDTDFGIEYEMVNVDCTDLIEIYFGKEWAARGYVWVFPKGEDVANVGVGVGGMEKGNAIDYLNKFLKLPRFARAQPVAVKAGLIPVGSAVKKMVLDNFMVAGTAAHQVDPIHGGGICLAMEAGALAGEVAAKAIEEGDASEKKLAEYEKRWRGKEEGKLAKRLLLRKVLEKLNDDDLNAIFENLNDRDIENLLEGSFAPVVKKVLSRRPQLLKVVGALV